LSGWLHRLLHPTGSRVTHVLLAVIAGIAVIGFFIGLAERAETGNRYLPEPDTRGIAHQAPPAPSYAEISEQDLSANAEWRNILSLLREVDPAIIRSRDPEALSRALAERMRRRAYAGAPPVVPHPIDQVSAASCLACHEDGLRVEERRVAPAMSHEFLANCTQCHVAAVTPELPDREAFGNDFLGSQPSREGPRAWAGAPPQIPHRLHMRQDCASCHGRNGRAALRTDHIERRSCTQCHVPAVDAERRQAPSFEEER